MAKKHRRRKSSGFDNSKIVICILTLSILGIVGYLWHLQKPSISFKAFNSKRYIPKTRITPKPAPDYVKELKNKIDYTIPEGWNENKEGENSVYLVFTTDNFKPGYEITGGRIAVREIINPTAPVESLAQSYTNSKGERTTKDDVAVTIINGHKAAYSLGCWEGCDLKYVVQNNDEFYEFTYRCGMDSKCNNKEGTINETMYYPDFMFLLQSVKFK